jgi:hypothetical protein
MCEAKQARVVQILQETIKMAENLMKFQAVFAEWTQPECRIVAIEFQPEDEKDALEIAQDIALLEGTELIYLSSVKTERELTSIKSIPALLALFSRLRTPN